MHPDMIVFGEDWCRHPSSTQHLMRRLARDRKVIWVNSLGLRRPRLEGHDLLRLAQKAGSLINSKSLQIASGEINPPLHPFTQLLNPQALPFPGSRLAAAFNRKSLARQIGAAIRQSGFTRPIVWTSLPTALPVIGNLGERAVIYYAGDDFGALAGVDHKPVLEAERKLAEKSDLIIAASAEIASRFDPDKTVVLPHGVDYDLFANPAPRARNLPQGKVAGFYGSLNGWIHIKAIADAANGMPDWTFVLIGKVETDISLLEDCPNVLLEPAMPHSELARWSQHWNVSLLPFLKNRQIDASNPLKLREYLAAGRPVAATYRFRAIADLQAPVATPSETESFSDAILAATKMRKQVNGFRQSLAGETWEARSRTVSELICSLTEQTR